MMNGINIDLSAIIQAVIGLLAALITYRVLPWIKSKTNIEQQTVMHIAVRTLVFAAEQIFGKGKGTEKLEYVKDRLIEKGFDIDVDAIEAAVLELRLEESYELAN